MFKVVVDELFVMLVVVLYQIKVFESCVGVLLFECGVGGVWLIEEGEWLFCVSYDVLLVLSCGFDVVCLEVVDECMFVLIMMLVFVVMWLILCFGVFCCVDLYLYIKVEIGNVFVDFECDVWIDFVICVMLCQFFVLYEIVLIDEYFGVYVVVGFDVYCMDVLFDLIEIVWDMLLFVLVDWVLWCCVVGW